MKHVPVLLSLCLLLPAHAWAQEASLGEAVAVLSTTALTPFSTSYLVVGAQAKGRTKELEESVKRLESIVRLERYLDGHERDVRLALVLGAGSSLSELAAIMGTPPLDARAFRALRASSKDLRAILDMPARRPRAAALYDRLRPMLAGVALDMSLAQGRL